MQDGQIRHPDNLHTTATTETSVEQAKQKPISQEDIEAARVKLESMKTQDGAKTSNAVDISHARHTNEVADHQGFHNPAAEVFNHSLETGASHPHHTGLPLASDNPAISRSFSGAVSAELRAENQHGLLSLKAPLPGEKSTAPKEEAPLPKLSEKIELPVPKFTGNVESHPAFRAKEEVDLKGKPEGTYQITRGSDEHGGYRLKIVVPDPKNPGNTLVKTMMLEKNDADGTFQLMRVIAGKDTPVGKSGTDLNQVIKDVVSEKYGVDSSKIDTYTKALITHEPPITKQTGKELLGVLSQTSTGQTDEAKQQAGEQLCKRLEGLKSATNEQLMEMREDLSNLSNTMSALNEMDIPQSRRDIHTKALETLKELDKKSNGIKKSIDVMNEFVNTENDHIKNLKVSLTAFRNLQKSIPEKDRPAIDRYIKLYEQAIENGVKVCSKLEDAIADIRANPGDHTGCKFNEIKTAMEKLKMVYESDEGHGLLDAYASISLMKNQMEAILDQVQTKKDPETKGPLTFKQALDRNIRQMQKELKAKFGRETINPLIITPQRIAKYHLMINDLASASDKIGNPALKKEMQGMGVSIENVVTPMDVQLAFDDMGKISRQIQDLEAKLQKSPKDVKLNAEMSNLMEQMRESVRSCLMDQGSKLGKNERVIVGEQLQKVVNYQKTVLEKKANLINAGITRLQKKPSEQLVQSSIGELNNLQKQNELDTKNVRSLEGLMINVLSQVKDPDKPEGKALEKEYQGLLKVRDLCNKNIQSRQAIIDKLRVPADAAASKLIQTKQQASHFPEELMTPIDDTFKQLAEVRKSLSSEPNSKTLLAKQNELLKKTDGFVQEVAKLADDIAADEKIAESLSALPGAHKLQTEIINKKMEMQKTVTGRTINDDQQKTVDNLRYAVDGKLQILRDSIQTIRKLETEKLNPENKFTSAQKNELKQAKEKRDETLNTLKALSTELNQYKAIFKLSDTEKSDIEELSSILSSPKLEERAVDSANFRQAVGLAKYALKPFALNYTLLAPKKRQMENLEKTMTEDQRAKLKSGELAIRQKENGEFELVEGGVKIDKGTGTPILDKDGKKQPSYNSQVYTQLKIGMVQQEEAVNVNLQLLESNYKILKDNEPKLNTEQKNLLKELKEVMENSNGTPKTIDEKAKGAQAWAQQHRTPGETLETVSQIYASAFGGDKPWFRGRLETDILIEFNNNMSKLDPPNKESYETLARLSKELTEASDEASKVLKQHYKTIEGIDEQGKPIAKIEVRVVTDQQTLEASRKAIGNLRAKLTEFQKIVQEIKLNESEFNKGTTKETGTGHRNLAYLKEGIKSCTNQLNELEKALPLAVPLQEKQLEQEEQKTA